MKDGKQERDATTLDPIVRASPRWATGQRKRTIIHKLDQLRPKRQKGNVWRVWLVGNRSACVRGPPQVPLQFFFSATLHFSFF